MDNWICHDKNLNHDATINCFKRRMPVVNIRRKEYFSYIYICNFETAEDLENNWKDVNIKIAVNDQSEIELLIERSNFYICFFVKENISAKLQSIIEGDTFAAKKYIYLDNDMSLNDKCEYLEKKIFTINIDSSFEIKDKVKRIELQNFRAYENRNQIDFCIDVDRPASFVTIYAPNGIGKTSIFDGLEYAFKGSIGRLSEIHGKEVGAIYHNRNHVNEKAYVDVELESSGSIKRNVASVNEGTDIRRNKPIKGLELVGKPEQWEQIILPHDKIDSFITAKSGVERYKEWISSTNIDVSISNNFTLSHKEIKENEKKILDTSKVIDKINEEILCLKKQTEKIDLWKSLIKNYNHNNEDRPLRTPMEIFEEEEYDSIINTVSSYIRKDLEIVKDCEKKKELAEKILVNSVDTYVEQLERIPLYQKNILDIQKKIENRRKYDELSQSNKYHNEEAQQVEKDLEPIYEIIEFGLGNIYKQKEEYLSRGQQIESYEHDIEVKLEQQNKYRELLYKKEKEIEELNTRISDELENNLIQLKLNNYLDFNIALLEIIKREDEVCNGEKSKAEEINKKSEKLKILKGKYITKNLSELKYQDILNLTNIMEADYIDNLKDFFDKYQEAVKSIEINQERNKKFQQNQRDLEELKQSGQTYINQHQDIIECPLCHTNFFEWDKLFDAVNMLEKDGEVSIQNDLKRLREEIVALNDEYDKVYKTFDETLSALINQTNKSLDKLENEKSILINNKNIIVEDKNRIIEKINEIRVFLDKEKIDVLEMNENTVKDWFEQQGRRINELQAFKKQYQEYVNNFNEEEKRINDFKLKQEEINKNTALIKHIKFLISKTSDYDIMTEKNNLDNKYEKEKNIIIKNNLEILKLNIKEEETLTYLLDEKNKEQNLLEDSIKLSDECEPLKPLTKDNVEKKLNDWKDKLKYTKANIEMLNQILEESGVREYYKELKKKELERVVKETLIKEKETLKTDLGEKYELAKRRLDKKLGEYFNQTIISEVFQKIDPHQTMKNIKYEFAFNQEDQPELFIRVSSVEGSDKKDSYRPECFFSSAQLNMVAFSSFFSRALQANDLPISTIFIDDPIGHFDDINILGFSDLLRSVMEVHDCQIVLTTHDDKVFQILQRKLNNKYYYSKFIKLPEDCIVK